MLEQKAMGNVDKFGGERIKCRGWKDTWLARMGTIRVGTTDWGEFRGWLSDRERQTEYLEATVKNDYRDWDGKTVTKLSPGNHEELNKELWALLMLKAEGEAKTKVRLARKGDGIGGFIRMDG